MKLSFIWVELNRGSISLNELPWQIFNLSINIVSEGIQTELAIQDLASVSKWHVADHEKARRYFVFASFWSLLLSFFYSIQWKTFKHWAILPKSNYSFILRNKIYYLLYFGFIIKNPWKLVVEPLIGRLPWLETRMFHFVFKILFVFDFNK